MPAYVKAFDVGLVPYQLTDYTANVYPTKLNEYLAMGMPVVATDLAEIRRFNADHGDIVRIGAGAEAFAQAIRAALTRSRARGSRSGASRSQKATAGAAASMRWRR